MKDHWLSQFYLRNFAISGYEKNDKAKIWLTDLQRGTCSIRKILDVAQATHFYSFKEADGKLCRRVDDKLTWLENRASIAYASLVQGTVDPSKWASTKSLVALFIATTLLRVPDQQRKTNEDHRQLLEAFEKFQKSSSGRPLVSYVCVGELFVPFDTSDYHAWKKDDKQSAKQRFAEKIEVLGVDIADRLFQKRWIIRCVDDPVFFTGDSPLIKVDEYGDECGIDDTNATVFFPLSPSRMLFMTERKEAEPDDYWSLPKDQAKACNVVTRANSPAFLFSPSELSSDEIADPRRV